MSGAFPTISELIPDLKSGNEVAWNALCEKFRSGMTSRSRYLLRTSGPGLKNNPEDLVQEVFLKAWKQRASFRGTSTSQLAGWMLTILRNTFHDWRRQEKPNLASPTWFEFADRNDTPSAIAISHEREVELHGCVARLCEQQQQVLSLRHFEGLKFNEIATNLEMNINTVAGVYRRGLRALAKELKKLHAGSSSAEHLFVDE